MSKEFKLDRWENLYAKRTSNLKSSEIRNLFIVTSRPDIISFAGGMPDTRVFPFKKIIEATKKVMVREGGAALQYGPSDGHEGLRECIAKIMAEENIHVHPEEILVTDGAQQALDLIGKIFIDPNDKIIVEAPCYVGALQVFHSYQADMISVPLDNNGLKINYLAQILDELKRKKVKPKFLYVVPNFHNPAGVTLSLSRRKKLLELAKKHNLLIIEDNPYSRLRFEGKHINSLRAFDKDVVYLGTFSKIFSPGIRLGWITAPSPILRKITVAKQAANLCTSPFAQRIAEEYFENNKWQEHVKFLIKLYKKRRDTMLKALEKYFPKEASWTKPEGGLFLWVTLPSYIDTSEMLAEAISEEKVAYVPGSAFFPDGSGKNHMRLNFSYPEVEEIKEGIKRLSKVVKRQMALYESLTKKGNKLKNKK